MDVKHWFTKVHEWVDFGMALSDKRCKQSEEQKCYDAKVVNIWRKDTDVFLQVTMRQIYVTLITERTLLVFIKVILVYFTVSQWLLKQKG